MKKQHWSVVTFLALAVASASLACSANDPDPGTDGDGGSGDTGDGGKQATGGKGGSGSGGKAAGGSGGKTSSDGGSPGSGGTQDTGGTPGSGGSGDGGSADGGSPGSGGSGDGGMGDGGAGDGGSAMGGSGAGGSVGAGGSGESGPLTFSLLGLKDMAASGFKAPAFPRAMSHGGGDHSPAIEWSGSVPAGTKSWAITMIDTNKTVKAGQTVDPKGGGLKPHFAYYDIPLAVRSLKADLPHTAMLPDPAGMKASANFTPGGFGWFGPGAGGDPHIYIITLWAIGVDTIPKSPTAQMAAYNAIKAASVGMPVEFVAVGTNNGI
jgi:phosphatidylethanolamine-binding protein (PEBP) family uncharacterized protein